VYKSLTAQTFRDFEWLICDDGSTDETPKLVERWQQDTPFPIRYLRQEHQGKHIAFNHGVREARGELFLTLDSDDACLPQALERLKYHWDRIPQRDKARFSAVTALCLDQHGRLVGTCFPFDTTDSDSLEIRYRFRVKGEKWGFHRTAVLRQFPFPVLEGERHMAPRLVWAAIARQYKTRYVNEALRIYYVHERPDQLTARATRLKHARALAFAYRAMLNDELDWFTTAPLAFVKSAIHYVRLSLHARCSPGHAIRQLDAVGARLLVMVTLPLGLASYLRDRMINRA
jgi:glycosyltransferase involved in cell wall biosynthesis